MTELSTLHRVLRGRGAAIGLEIVINVALPFLIYEVAQPYWGDVRALFASMLAPLAWSFIEFLRHRRIDALSILVLGGIVLSLLAFIGTGSARFLQLRENLVTGLIGALFLGSVIVRQPLIYILARAIMRRSAGDSKAEKSQLDDDPELRHSMMVMTLVWGLGLIAQAALASVLVFYDLDPYLSPAQPLYRLWDFGRPGVVDVLVQPGQLIMRSNREPPQGRSTAAAYAFEVVMRIRSWAR